jgi:hypothetical protein
MVEAHSAKILENGGVGAQNDGKMKIFANGGRAQRENLKEWW